MIFARSRRSTAVLGTSQAAFAVALTAGSGILAVVKGWAAAAVVAAMLAATAGAFSLRSLRRLLKWPPGRLGFFRDRLVVVIGRTELRALWDRIEICGLADQSEWARASWPEVRLTDRLTIRLRGEPPIVFRPAAFGLEPVACRDLILRLRDDSKLRERLPEFDSALDLSSRPLFSGELIQPPI